MSEPSPNGPLSGMIGAMRRRQSKSRLRQSTSFSDISEPERARLGRKSIFDRMKRRIIRFYLPLVFILVTLQVQFSVLENTVNAMLHRVTTHLLTEPMTPSLALWRGSVVMKSGERHKIDDAVKIDLVVSHCDTPLNWIFEEWAPTNFQFANIYVFSKCSHPVLGVPLDAKIVRLPNVGRCDHTYAHYISNYYYGKKEPSSSSSSSSSSDYVLFLKDNSNQHRFVYSRHRPLPELIKIANTRGFACHEERLWNIGTIAQPICQTSMYHSWSKLRQMDIDTYVRVARDREQLSQFSSQHGSTLGAYADYLGISLSSSSSFANQTVVPVCYGGNFLASSQQFHHHGALWPKMEATLNRAPNIAEGHFVERLWALLLSRPLNAVQARIILDQAQEHDCAKKSFFGAFCK